MAQGQLSHIRTVVKIITEVFWLVCGIATNEQWPYIYC